MLEFVDSIGKLFVKIDIYVFLFLIKFVYRFLRFRNIVIVKNVLVISFEERLIIKVLIGVLCIED